MKSEDRATSPQTSSPERRRDERVQCVLEARVDFNDVLREEVIVRNLSRGGAMIEVPRNLFIPQQFYLSGLIDDQRIHCELVWRRGEEVGVRFTAPA